MSVNMLGLRFTNDAHARSKNGHPAQKTTGVASTRPVQFSKGPQVIVRRPPPTMSATLNTTKGRPRRPPIQNRRVMSINSGFGCSDNEMTRGSSAIPQIGHDPGALLTISGCIGHVYSVEPARSSAFSEFG